jgi:hypothetical protein
MSGKGKIVQRHVPVSLYLSLLFLSFFSLLLSPSPSLMEHKCFINALYAIFYMCLVLIFGGKGILEEEIIFTCISLNIQWNKKC